MKITTKPTYAWEQKQKKTSNQINKFHQCSETLVNHHKERFLLENRHSIEENNYSV